MVDKIYFQWKAELTDYFNLHFYGSQNWFRIMTNTYIDFRF